MLEIHVGTPFVLSLLVGIPSLRVNGLYLAIATIAAELCDLQLCNGPQCLADERPMSPGLLTGHRA